MKLSFIVSNKCNLNCTYCYQKEDYSYENLSFLDIEQKLIEAMNIVKNRENPNDIRKELIEVQIIGGETFLFLDDIEKLVYSKNLKNQIFKYSFITNGTLLEKYFDRILKLKEYIESNNGVLNLSLSYDGQKNSNLFRVSKNKDFKTGDYLYNLLKTNENIKKLNLVVRTTILYENLNMFFEIFKEVVELGYSFSFSLDIRKELMIQNNFFELYDNEINKINNYIKENNLKLDTFQYYKNEFKSKQFTCQAPGHLLTFDSKGNVFLCNSAAVYEELKIGTIKENINILFEKSKVFLTQKNDEKCKSCNVLFCKSCPVENYRNSKKESILDKWKDEVSEIDCNKYKIIDKNFKKVFGE